MKKVKVTIEFDYSGDSFRHNDEFHVVMDQAIDKALNVILDRQPHPFSPATLIGRGPELKDSHGNMVGRVEVTKYTKATDET